MTLAKLLAAAALATGIGLAAPGDAEADHRHHRGCDHGPRYDRSYRHEYRSYGYDDRYRSSYRSSRYYGPYGSPYGYYGYERPYYRSWSPYGRVYYGPPPRYGYGSGVAFHYHGGARCSRPHVSINVGW